MHVGPYNPLHPTPVAFGIISPTQLETCSLQYTARLSLLEALDRRQTPDRDLAATLQVTVEGWPGSGGSDGKRLGNDAGRNKDKRKSDSQGVDHDWKYQGVCV
jgi:hypothetical protein